jgi:hypothetical protein
MGAFAATSKEKNMWKRVMYWEPVDTLCANTFIRTCRALRTMLFATILLALSTISLAAQRSAVDLTKSTRWRDNRAVRILDGTLRFSPERDEGDEVRECAKITIDMGLRNNSERPIERIDFEIVLYGNESGDRDSGSKTTEKFSYDHRIQPGSTRRFLYEVANCDLFSPVRQTVRIVRVVYEDGSAIDKRKR